VHSKRIITKKNECRMQDMKGIGKLDITDSHMTCILSEGAEVKDKPLKKRPQAPLVIVTKSASDTPPKNSSVLFS
jgi:hypothetical protein